ncbi:unnamed protein product [Lactuca saligna]|uniref:Uncharacterized protein n=1 Tax=Lactuca saligna TaxID=75948 RepID=A0AA35YNH1_LACSI|nr:unnamed protein product [Lactuca saligna]
MIFLYPGRSVKATPGVVVTLQEITRVIATKVPEEIDACLHDGSLWLLRNGCIGCYKEENFEGDGKVLEMMKHEVPIALGMYNIRIQILCKLKKTILVRELLNWLISINVKPNSITYNHFIHGYCKEGKLVVLKRAMFDPLEMFNKIAENKKDGEAVVIYNARNSAPGRTSHPGFMEEGSCSEALVKFKKDDGSSFHYLPPCLIIHENGKTDEAVKLIMGAMEQMGGIYMVIGVVVANHGKTDGKKKRPPERIWVSCINSIHLEDKVVLLGRVLLCINFCHI